MRKLFPFALTLIPMASAWSDVTLPPLISDNMLLQAPKAAVWGKADPGEKVTVSLGKTSATATAGDDGKWRVELDGLTPGNAGALTVEGKNKLTVQNVAVGEVWVGSGQSNMQWQVSHSQNPEQEIAAASFPEIRMFNVPRKVSPTPLEEVAGKWQVCSPQNVPNWSAVGYYFARQLHQNLKSPIGIIHTSWGGTRAEAWTPGDAIMANPLLEKEYHQEWQKRMADYPALKAAHDEKMVAWATQAEAAKAAGQPEPKKPMAPLGPDSQHAPAVLYNCMIHGATPYTIKGVIWYQGESNAGKADTYKPLLSTLIASWRAAWKNNDLPFLIVQLANYLPGGKEPVASKWAELRDAQRLTTLEVPHTGLAVALDIGNPSDIHPKNKQEVGRRLALIAEASTYGKAVVSSGPFFDDAKFDGNQVTVRFKPGTADGLTTHDGAAVKGFTVAGADKNFVAAEAKIDKASSTVIITSPQATQPVAVRYAWANSPEINLVNKEGLPASSFRTDDWPIVSEK